MDRPQRHQLEYGRKKPEDVNYLRALALAIGATAIIIAAILAAARLTQPPPLSSASRLRIIGHEAMNYAVSYGDGHFPDTFETLVRADQTVLKPEHFTSPKGPATPAPDFETMFRQPGHISYVWVGTGLNWNNVEADFPLLYEGPVTDFDAGTRVFFVDGSMRLIKGDELRTLLSEAENRLRRASTTSPTTQTESGDLDMFGDS